MRAAGRIINAPMLPQARGLIAFVGDSVAEHVVAVSDAMETQIENLPPVGAMVRVDRHETRGWVALAIARITLGYPQLQLRFLNAGRGGDTSRLLRQRLESDVLVHRPQWCLLSTGLVDVRRAFQPERGAEAVNLEEYESNLRDMTRKSIDVGSHIVLLEPTPHSRPPAGASAHAQLSAVNDATLSYVAAMRKIAAECDVGAVRLFQPILEVEQRLNGRTPASTLYADEVHLNLLGDVMYSELVLDFLADAWR